ncbi:hypothetical protein MM236_01115 [Belliella sp. DSM 107340]|uniref:DUF3168 domain-containing protein n=1 Tax=Belliella calami TaxID=2923436 RepID=A0ABS9UIW7_9BACT|nr:hypothetical protein [Belliella calami]MCH7396561.1 hypothetical protein [Belliella calami]
MNLIEYIVLRVNNDSGLQSIINNNFLPLVNQNQYDNLPLVTYIVSDETPISNKLEKAEVDEYIIEFDVFSDRFFQLENICNLLRDLFEAHKAIIDNKEFSIDFLNFKTSYKSDAKVYNKTVRIIAHF